MIDIVDVSLRSDDLLSVIDDTIKKKDKVKVFWMQEGI